MFQCFFFWCGSCVDCFWTFYFERHGCELWGLQGLFPCHCMWGCEAMRFGVSMWSLGLFSHHHLMCYHFSTLHVITILCYCLVMFFNIVCYFCFFPSPTIVIICHLVLLVLNHNHLLLPIYAIMCCRHSILGTYTTIFFFLVLVLFAITCCSCELWC